MSRTNSALTSSNSRIKPKTYRLCLPNLVKKWQLWYIPECRESFTSRSAEVNSLRRSKWHSSWFPGSSPRWLVFMLSTTNMAAGFSRPQGLLAFQYGGGRGEDPTTQKKSRYRFVHGEWKFIQNGGQDRGWEDLGTRSCMVGHSFQNYDIVYVGFLAAYNRL